jgi:hypothetical protein
MLIPAIRTYPIQVVLGAVEQKEFDFAAVLASSTL